MRIFCLAVLFAVAGPLAADDAPEKPGFWKRTWDGTKKGVGNVLSATKKAGEKTVGAVTSPFRKGGREEAPASNSWRKLEMTMKFEPAEVRLPATRFLDVRVDVTNKGKETVQLEFPSSLRVDVVLKDDTGKVLSRWSDDQRIEREPSVLIVNPGERLEYNARVSTRDMQAGRRFEIEAVFPSYEKLRVSRVVSPVN